MRQKKIKTITKKEEPSETHSADDGNSSDSGGDMKEINSTTATAVTTSKPPAYMQNEYIYDINMLYDQIIKLNNPNYAGNSNL